MLLFCSLCFLVVVWFISPRFSSCQFLHRTAGDTERRYHLRYYKTCMCVHDTDSRGYCVKNGPHCAFAHGNNDIRPPVFDIKEIQVKVMFLFVFFGSKVRFWCVNWLKMTGWLSFRLQKIKMLKEMEPAMALMCWTKSGTWWMKILNGKVNKLAITVIQWKFFPFLMLRL